MVEVEVGAADRELGNTDERAIGGRQDGVRDDLNLDLFVTTIDKSAHGTPGSALCVLVTESWRAWS